MADKFKITKINKVQQPQVQHLLPQINSSADLAGLTVAQLYQLAEEIRLYILDVVSKNGGHLAPNLGVVELTLALHRVFDIPSDKLIWDVGHQSYTHKILTGRRDQFATLRTYGGLSGFPKREESPADPFNTGHSSTAISAALGFAQARDVMGEDYQVVAVVGDGALTGGISYEALCHCGDLGSKLIVVLNDNEMSINSNVGAMSNYLVRIRTSPKYGQRKQEIEQILKSIPRVGPYIAHTIDRMKDSLKYFLMPGMIFEELGFIYLGPVYGHDIESMITLLNRAKSIDKPVLLHVITKKGKGYVPAQNNPDIFHGTGPFDIGTGLLKNPHPSLTYSEVFGDTLCRLAAENEKIMAITAAMTNGTGLSHFFEQYPQRSFDVGIAEGHAVTFAAGLAAAEARPVVAVYSSFLQRAYDQILHDVCLQQLPVVFAIDRAGLVGDDGPTHHGVFDISFLSSMPNMVLMAPKDENELQAMLKSAFTYEAPVAIRYPRGTSGLDSLKLEVPLLPFGKAQVLREGDNLAVFACGSMVNTAVELADILWQKGLSVTVINVRFIKPLDEELLIATAQKCGRVLTMEEGIKKGGFGCACAELLRQKGLRDIEIEIAALPDQFIPQGNRDILLDNVGMSPQKLAQKVLTRWFSELKNSDNNIIDNSEAKKDKV
ncbi:MAG: 1-deoxy-D-xylulose-5-phosphate synthase [Bacillota bacterium]|jgi:1-deoxy-D-xylulose-5-phosphate synthase